MNAMSSRRALPLIVAFVMIAATDAGAQLLPWPTDPSATGPARAVVPGPQSAAPPMSAPPQMALPQMAPPQMAPPLAGSPGSEPPCLAEFTKLRLETEKRSGEAKAGNERKAPREEMCKLIQNFAAAEAKWVKYTQDNTAKCGIPPKVGQQLKAVHARTLTIRKQVCSAGPLPGAAPQAAAPSLSDALGTTRLPVPETTRSGAGTLDTLTGNAIAR